MLINYVLNRKKKPIELKKYFFVMVEKSVFLQRG